MLMFTRFKVIDKMKTNQQKNNRHFISYNIIKMINLREGARCTVTRI